MPSAIDSHSGERFVAQRLVRLGEILVSCQHLWQSRAFHHVQLPWESGYPELSGYLRGLSYEQAVMLQASDDALLEALTPYLPVAAELRELITLPMAKQKKSYPYASRLVSEIPGRKLSQIDAFLDAINIDGKSIIDWCSGKGHLSRMAACRLAACNERPESSFRRRPGSGKSESDIQVTGLEWNADLVERGNHFARQHHLPVCIHHVDVMSALVDDYLNQESQVLALHACGDLHLQLLHKVTEHRCVSVNLSPCCYHLITENFYPPLSHLAKSRLEKNQAPLLSKDHLRTAVQQTVTAPGYVRKQREKLQAWRLGFDLLQRQLLQSDKYLSLTSLPSSSIKTSFAEFCCHVAELKAIPLPDDVDFSCWEAAGQKRFVEVTTLDLARLAFRRAMEVWLIMDRAQYLHERGYAVAVSQFCSGTLTPRNFLLAATRIQ